MKRLALALAVVALGACKKAEPPAQAPAAAAPTADTSHMMMSDTSHMMMSDTSKKMAAPAAKPAAATPAAAAAPKKAKKP